MALKSADFVCEACECRWDMLVDSSTWDKDYLHEVTCPACGKEQKIKRAVGAPAVLRASWPDGWRRKHHESYRKLREASQIRREEVNLPLEKRTEHQKERHKLTKLKT